MALGKIRVIEVVGRVVSHADLLHHATRTNVRGDGEGNQGIERQRFERVANRRAGRFRGKASSPILRGQPPSDFYARREMSLEGRNREPRKSNERTLLAKFERVQAKFMFAEMTLDAINKEIAFGGR